MKFHTFLYLLLILFFSYQLNAQQYNFRNYSIEEGLPQSQVYAITEDNNGYIWLGTRGGGISRFDGLNFTNITTSQGLCSDFINCFKKDNKGRIFIGTDNCLTMYDGSSFNGFGKEKGLYNEKIYCLESAPDGVIWIGTEKGIYHFDKDTIYRFGRKLGIPMERINCLYRSKAGEMWAGTEKGIYRIFMNERKQWEYKLYRKSDGLPADEITCVKEDKKGGIWICTYGGGVCRFDNQSFSVLKYSDGLPSNTVYTCNPDADGSIWFGTPSGVCNYNPVNNIFRVYTEKEGLSNNVVSAIYQDKSGNNWFGTSGGGVSKLSDMAFIHYSAINGLMGSWVYSILQDKNGNTWFGTSEGGVTKYDGKFYKRFSQRHGFTAHKVRAIFEDSIGRLWFGTTSDGCYIYDGKVFRHYATDNGLSSNFINYITSDSYGRILLATAGGGITVADFTGNKITFSCLNQKNGLAGDRVSSVHTDRNGVVWAACYGQGISKIIPEKDLSYKIENFKSSVCRNARCIVSDQSGNIYIGTADKAIAVSEGNSFSQLDNLSMLNSRNIYSLIFDDVGNLFAGTEKGLDRITFDNYLSIKSVKHFGKAEGFRGIETIQNSVHKDKTGKLWFGSVKCATVFDPEASRTAGIPTVLLNGVTLFFEDINLTQYAPGKSGKHGKILSLPYHKNHLGFQFTGIEHSNPEGVQYKWKLEGFDEEWSPVSKRREAVYSNLPPGKYTFCVLAANEDHKWGKPVHYAFVITPPFWKTWWFLLTCGLTVTSVVAGGMYLNVRAIRKRNEKEKAVLEMQKNLLELEQKALRLQMNPHFLFNCLNSIKGLIAEGNSENAKLYLTRFSKLMRAMLEYSRQSFIALENEIEYLRNYIELEKLSFGDKLEFRIEVSDELISAKISIPPMLIQPFVENSLIHGIAPRQSKGKVIVNFSIENNHIACVVEDDGIGREAAAQRSLQNDEKYASAAIAVTQERLNMVNRIMGYEGSGIEVTDLKNERGNAGGTKVKLLIPYKEV
jgi:ligand-binding sensor domain-containing protein